MLSAQKKSSSVYQSVRVNISFSRVFRSTKYPSSLGIKSDASAEEIKKNFRELAKKTHPDKTKENSEEEMIKINKAYEILSDVEAKEKYDKYMKSN